jgi:hypothetical protein
MHPGLLHPQYRFSGPSPLRSSGELCGPPPGFWPRTGGFSEAGERRNRGRSLRGLRVRGLRVRAASFLGQ